MSSRFDQIRQRAFDNIDAMNKKYATSRLIAASKEKAEDDSHLMRVYQAVKDGEWSFEDFKDFVSVVRNEAKIRD